MTQTLDDQRFLNIIDATPLVSLDLIVRNNEGKILLGLRDNKPAQGYWFVPGGRIRKNETIAEAFRRLCLVELGLDKTLEQASLLGPYDHLYDDNFKGAEGIGTHYVAIAYTLNLNADEHCNLDDQHSQQRWWHEAELLASEQVHANTRAYFEA